MKQPVENLITFDQFVDFLQTQPENIIYELYNGDIIQMPLPTGEHEDIVTFLIQILVIEYHRLQLNYGIASKTLVKPENKLSGYFPDVLLLNRSNLVNEPYWKKQSIIARPESVVLVIEVVSNNWRDDYLRKYADYGEMGIGEYWIVDYGAFGGKEFIGNPKQPTITIYYLNDEGEYTGRQFRGNERIESPTFTELNLTAQQIFTAQLNY